ncbi:MAG: hypothetical protein OHK0015_36020 [Chloroflexi bacterium OHK40]
MPARIIEELTSRKKEKIATFLTFESIVAVLICFMPVFMISGSWPLLTRVPLCVAAAVAGYVLTVEVQGLPLYEHVQWTARGLFRLRVHGNRIGPEDLPGAVPAPDQDRVVAASGPIELVQRRPASTSPVALPVAPARRSGPPDGDEAAESPTELSEPVAIELV